MRLRRQHWCCLSVFLLAVVLCVALGLPISDTEHPGGADGAADDGDAGGAMKTPGFEFPATPEARLAAVHSLFNEIPLVDG